MADERYEWLDKEAAERLLRGEPVGPVGDHARAQAERLSAALDGVARAGGREAGELPGEAAALAAFRKARAASPDAFPTVRIGRKAPAPVRWVRPVRLGLAGALAGVALGGVAVAAGTGVLPSPFGRGTDPAPAPPSSVSAAATPPVASETAIAEPRETRTRPPAGTGTPAPETPNEPAGTHESSPEAGAVATPTFPGWTGEATPGTGDDAGTPSANVYRNTVKACQDYRAGRLAPDRERRLAAAAKGADRVERFCDRLLDGSDAKDSGAAEGGGGASGPENGGSHGDKRGPGGIRRIVPPVSYPQPPTPTAAPPTTTATSPHPG